MEGSTVNHETFLQPVEPGGGILSPGLRDALSDRIHACLPRPMQDIRAGTHEFPSQIQKNNIRKATFN